MLDCDELLVDISDGTTTTSKCGHVNAPTSNCNKERTEWQGEVFLSEGKEAEAARKKSVVDGLSETVSRILGTSQSNAGTMSGRNSRADLHDDIGEGEAAPPLLPRRTSDSYILTDEQRIEAAARAEAAGVMPRVPTSPRPTGGGGGGGGGGLMPPNLPTSPRPLSTCSGGDMGGSQGRLTASSPASGSPASGGPGAGHSATLPSSGRHTSPPHSQPSSTTTTVMSSTKDVFKKLVRGRNPQRNAHGPPANMTISSPVGIGSHVSDGSLNSSTQSPVQPAGSTVPVFSDEMGFKNRVPRPKGPRSMPATWRTFA